MLLASNGASDLLDCSHFFGRSDSGTKYEPDNADSYCRGHHTGLEKQKKPGDEYYRLKAKKIGNRRLKELDKLSSSIVQLRDFEKLERVRNFIEKINQLGYDVSNLKFKYRKILL